MRDRSGAARGPRGTGRAASGGVPGRRGGGMGAIRPVVFEPRNCSAVAARGDVPARSESGKLLGVAEDPIGNGRVLCDTSGLLIGIGQPKKVFDGLHA